MKISQSRKIMLAGDGQQHETRTITGGNNHFAFKMAVRYPLGEPPESVLTRLQSIGGELEKGKNLDLFPDSIEITDCHLACDKPRGEKQPYSIGIAADIPLDMREQLFRWREEGKKIEVIIREAVDKGTGEIG